MWWIVTDSSRDIVAAHHIIDFREITFASPGATGGMEIFKNSPFYYFLISFFWILWPSPFGATFIFALTGVLTVFITYKTGNLFNKRAGIISLILGCFSFLMISASRELQQPNVAIIFNISAIYFLLKGYKERSIKSFFLFIFFALIQFHIHYSFLSLLPAYFFGGLYVLKKITKGLRDFMFSLLITVGIFLSWALVPNIVGYNTGSLVLNGNLEGAFDNLSAAFTRTIFGIDNKILFGIFILFFLYMIFWKRKIIFENLFLLMILFSGLIPGLIYAWAFDGNYLNIYFPIFILIFSLTVSDKKIINNFLLLFILFFSIYKNLYLYKERVVFLKNEYKHSGEIADKIIDDFKKYNHDFGQINVWHKTERDIDPITPGIPFTYLIEKKTGQKITKMITDSGTDNGHVFINENKKIKYLVCSAWYKEGVIKKNCLEKTRKELGFKNSFILDSYYNSNGIYLQLFRLEDFN